jgi:hypothetical protein
MHWGHSSTVEGSRKYFAEISRVAVENEVSHTYVDQVAFQIIASPAAELLM